jgi:DNA-binding CsgD family transcriptional regulator
VIDSSFLEKDLFKSILYYHDINNSKDITSIQLQEFIPFNKSFPGLKKTKFWFKLNLKNEFSKEKELVLKVKAHTITSLKLFNISNDSLKSSFEFSKSNKKKVNIPISLKAKSNNTVYIEVFFSRSVFFPAKLASLERNRKINQNLLINDALFYGFALVVLIINLFFFINTKNKFFLYYCLLLVAIIVSVMNVSGMFSSFFDAYKIEFKTYFVLLLNFFTIYAYIIFTTNSLRLNRFYPKHKLFGNTFLTLFILFSVLYISTNTLLWYWLVKIVYLSTVIVYWFFGILLFKRQAYAKFLTIAYSILIAIQTAYMLSINFGYTQVGFTEQYYKLGCVIEMLVFLYAISYRHKKVEIEKESIHENLKKELEMTNNLVQENRIIKEQIKEVESENLSEEEVYVLFVKKYSLTSRELEICSLIIKGNSNDEIVELASIKMTTVKYHISNIFKKLNVKNRTEVLALYISFKESI